MDWTDKVVLVTGGNPLTAPIQMVCVQGKLK